jgi:hypothetical protein
MAPGWGLIGRLLTWCRTIGSLLGEGLLGVELGSLLGKEVGVLLGVELGSLLGGIIRNALRLPCFETSRLPSSD